MPRSQSEGLVSKVKFHWQNSRQITRTGPGRNLNRDGFSEFGNVTVKLRT